MTNTVSHLCGFADTTNTGVPSGTTLYRVPQDITAPTAQTGSGWTWNAQYQELQTTASNALITNVIVSGTVNFTYGGGTLQNSEVVVGGAGSWGVTLRHASNTTIKNCVIHGVAQSSPNMCGEAIREIYGDSENLTVKNTNIYWCSNPINNISNGGLIQQNYMHDLGNDSTSHYEDIQFEPGSGQLMTFRDNTLFNQHTDQTAAIILSNDGGGTQNNRLIDHNLLAGGGWTFYGSGGPSAAATNITFTNNHFSRIFAASCGGFGPAAYWKTGNGNVASGNVWDDTGATLSL